jgi:hypothetical protein
MFILGMSRGEDRRRNCSARMRREGLREYRQVTGFPGVSRIGRVDRRGGDASISIREVIHGHISLWASFRCSNAVVINCFRSHAGGAVEQRNGCHTSGAGMRSRRLARTVWALQLRSCPTMLARPLWRRALRVKVELRVSEARNNRCVNTLLNGPRQGPFFYNAKGCPR